MENSEYTKYLRIYKEFADFTMIPRDTYIKNLILCESFLNKTGAVVECGVWRGGMIAGIARLFSDDRQYYLFDSFEGLPQAQDIDGKAIKTWQANKTSPAYYDNCKAEESFAQEAMKRSGAKNFHIKRGWFDKTMPDFPPEQQIAILRIDADLYDSTLLCLKNLYKYVAKGGCIIIDDYYTWEGCSKAVHDFLSQSKSADRIYQYYNDVCFIAKKSLE